MPFSVQEIQTSRFSVKEEECQAPIAFADILGTNIKPLYCNSSTSDVYLPASGKIIEQYKYFMPVFMLMIQRGQSNDFIWKIVVVLTDCNLKSNSSVFEFQLSNSSGLAIFIPGCATNTGGKCILHVYLLCFRSHSGPVVPALWSLPQCWKHAPLSVPGGLHWQLLRGAAG